jgi:hypothetical protein
VWERMQWLFKESYIFHITRLQTIRAHNDRK